MDKHLKSNVEEQLQNELTRFKSVVDYIEQIRFTHSQSQQLYENAQKLFAEITEVQEQLKVDIQSSISAIETKKSDMQKDLKQFFLALISDIKIKNTNAISLIEKDIRQINKKINEQNKKITMLDYYKIDIDNFNNKIKQYRFYFILLFTLLVIVFVAVAL